MTISHSNPTPRTLNKAPHTTQHDPSVWGGPSFHGIHITALLTNEGHKRPKAIAGTESGVSLVDVSVSKRLHDTEKYDVTYRIPGLPSEMAPDLSAALSVQEALLTRELAKEVQERCVDRLAANNLLVPRSDRWREAISTALLGGWSAPLWSEGRLSSTAVAALKAEARMLHRQLVPVWRRKTRHGRVLSLDVALGNGLSLYDLVAADVDLLQRVAGRVFEDERLNAVLRGLTSAEQQVVFAYAEGEGTTWVEAAACAGATDPEAFGKRVRCKARRLAAEQRRRRELRSPGTSPMA